MLKDVFAFAESQEKAIYGLDYKLTLTRIEDDDDIDKTEGIADARIENDHFHWYVTHYTPSTQEQIVLQNQNLKKTPTELRYFERCVFMKEVNYQSLWNFKLDSQKIMNVPILITIGFQRRNRQDSRNLNNDSFYKLPVTSSHCVIGTEKYPDAGIILNYGCDDYNQGYHEIEEAFRALTKDNVLQPHIKDDDFRSSNARADDFRCNLHVFVIRYQKIFTASQPIELEFEFD